jgi:hypothetical protein
MTTLDSKADLSPQARGIALSFSRMGEAGIADDVIALAPA